MLSQFGKRISILSRMGKYILAVKQAKRSHPQEVIDLCSGDPRVFPELAKVWQECAEDIIAEGHLGEILGTYGDVAGNERFLAAIINLFKPLGLQLRNENIFITPGALSCIFYSLITYAGDSNGKKLNIFLTQCPEYQAYENKGIATDQFVSLKPKIEILTDHTFRYVIDLNEMDFTNVGAVLLTRPSNTTGFVLPDNELQILVDKAREHNIPVIIDGVYSSPIPDLIYKENVSLIFNKNVIFLMSFSKAGLASGRLGVAIGDEEFLRPLRIFQLNMCITMQAFSQLLAARALETHKLQQQLKNTIHSYYQDRLRRLKNLFQEYMDEKVSYYLHPVDGGIFQWVWFKDLPITDQELYERLKLRNIHVMPGNIFFFDLKDKNWSHKNECLRITLNEPDDRIDKGIKTLAEIVNKLYRNA